MLGYNATWKITWKSRRKGAPLPPGSFDVPDTFRQTNANKGISRNSFANLRHREVIVKLRRRVFERCRNAMQPTIVNKDSTVMRLITKLFDQYHVPVNLQFLFVFLCPILFKLCDPNKFESGTKAMFLQDTGKTDSHSISMINRSMWRYIPMTIPPGPTIKSQNHKPNPVSTSTTRRNHHFHQN